MHGDDASDYQRVSNEARNGATSRNGYDAAPSHAASWSEASSRVSSLDSGSRPQAPYSAVPDVSDEEDGYDDDGVAREQQQQRDDAPSRDPGERASATTLVNDGKNDAPSEVLTDEASTSGEPTWMPFYLRRVFLLGFAVVFILMIVALEVLYFFSVRDGGLATVEESLHYLWTYGPTFVLTMAAALWGQVEHSAKQMMPWSLMSRGETVAKHGLLLNYLTSSMPGSLIRSLRRRHFAVSIGISGSLVLRLLIIFSTGLLSLEYRSVTSSRDFVFQDDFDLSKDYAALEDDGFRPLSNTVNFWATLNYNLSYPHGATSQYALQSFAPSDDGNYINVTADVLVFEALLENCEAFNFTYDTGGSTDTFGISLSRAAPKDLWNELEQWCYEGHTTYGSTDSVADGLLSAFQNLTQHIYKCTNSTPIEEQEDRILITLDTWLSVDQAETSGIMCEPKYSLTRRTVTNATGAAGIEDGLNVSSAVQETLDLGSKPFNVTSNIIQSMDGEWSGVFTTQANVWYTMLNTSQPQSSLKAFRNTSLTTELSQGMFASYAAYTIKKDFMDTSNRTANGTVAFTENRLCVQELSLRLMEALLALLALLSIALCFFPPGVFHRDPRPVGAHALMLARSPALIEVLSGYGASSKQALRARLSGYTATFPQQKPPAGAAITVTARDGTKTETDEMDQGKWWHPLPLTLWFRGLLVAIAIAIIVALEVLLQASDKHNGLADVVLEGYQKYAWTLIPSLVMASIGLAFSLVDSITRALHPFHLLRRGRASFNDLLYDPAGQVSLVAAVRAARQRHFALLAILLTGLLAPMLTIVTSGLYTAVPVPSTHSAALQMQDWFNLDNRTVSRINTVDNDSGEGRAIFQLVQFSNLSYPQWTHGAYAFSSFSGDGLAGEATSVRARLPAVRANLNCSLLHYYTHRNFTYDANGFSYVFVPIDAPAGCHAGRYSSNDTSPRQLWLSVNALNQWGAHSDGPFVALLKDDYSTASLAFEDKYVSTPKTLDVCADGRQHLFYGAGTLTGDIFDDLALMHCMPYVEALFVTANLSLPGLELSTADQPLVPDEDSAVFLSSSASATAIGQEEFAIFTSALVNGSTHGVGDLATITGRANVDAFRHALESLYAVYAAQNLNFNYRLALDPATNLTSFLFPTDASRHNSSNAPGTMEKFIIRDDDDDAVLTAQQRLRLKQSPISTRILEGLIAAMAVCLIAAAVLETMTLGLAARVLPKDPGSVAAKMTLFAEGDAWPREVPVGADMWPDRVLVRKGVFEGRLFGLRWWGGAEDGGGRRFGVDIASAESR
ncbi:hypothetical protein BFW01_g12268 [Lasiodiplodia theobromae]|uniref:Uncharacterized protein n=1 Tax=Lasiodiplodia theobromae TaxID=45133 RepID=A0A5N5CW80_9PEZI|nr:uncharacterized protein LTHEOB_12502 [Lasiodiplodia theobromae]KAB2569610.1 hypothetical protein DBV05_g11723 [Lasiodiplodia theobromae]KAF4535826.1 hypothetical protein LTHEOB_12502 [Lasiodiplodia theobromae]KAF9640462.1 hypothetical protein BFW01_g12268 [Lasiodiplodia theobromae]